MRIGIVLIPIWIRIGFTIKMRIWTSGYASKRCRSTTLLSYRYRPTPTRPSGYLPAYLGSGGGERDAVRVSLAGGCYFVLFVMFSFRYRPTPTRPSAYLPAYPGSGKGMHFVCPLPAAAP